MPAIHCGVVNCESTVRLPIAAPTTTSAAAPVPMPTARKPSALERASPTRVANTMTVNPIAAGLLAAQLVGEPITANLVLGLIAVFAGIWIATSEKP